MFTPHAHNKATTCNKGSECFISTGQKPERFRKLCISPSISKIKLCFRSLGKIDCHQRPAAITPVINKSSTWFCFQLSGSATTPAKHTSKINNLLGKVAHSDQLERALTITFSVSQVGTGRFSTRRRHAEVYLEQINACKNFKHYVTVFVFF